MTVYYHKGDLPADVDLGNLVAIDTETLGLSLTRDALCVVQLSSGDGNAHVVQMLRPEYDCPNLKKMLSNPDVEKIFHFARFDVGMVKKYLDVTLAPVFCTKIASKLCRTYTDRHGLKDVTRELLGIDMNKQQQSSDWAAEELTKAQLDYAASDVLHLHALREKLIFKLEREGRMEMAKACFDFLPVRADLDLAGWPETDIFAHS